MSEEKNNKTHILNIRVAPAEYQYIHDRFLASQYRKISSFLRGKLLEEPNHIICQNQSGDDLITELVQLRREVNGMRSNYNQMMKKLSALARVPEFQAELLTYEVNRRQLEKYTEEINVCISKMAARCLQ